MAKASIKVKVIHETFGITDSKGKFCGKGSTLTGPPEVFAAAIERGICEVVPLTTKAGGEG